MAQKRDANSIKDANTMKVKFLLLLVFFGLVAFFLISSTFPFRNSTFRMLFPKSFSRASEADKAPKVNLRISGKNIINDRVVNISKDDSSIVLIWTTSGNPTSCIGRSFGLTAQDDKWNGPKDPKGGQFSIKDLSINNPYVYTIDCSNSFGDADGSSITINVGAQNLSTSPYISTFDFYLREAKESFAYLNNQKFDSNPQDISIGDKVIANWATLNTATPYSICISSGSFPQQYKSLKNYKFTEELSMESKKIYKYTIFCSNENSFAQNTQSFFAN